MNPFPRVSVPGVSTPATSDAFRFILAMRRTGRPIYGGSVPASTVARRRAANRRAAASRRANR